MPLSQWHWNGIPLASHQAPVSSESKHDLANVADEAENVSNRIGFEECAKKKRLGLALVCNFEMC